MNIQAIIAEKRAPKPDDVRFHGFLASAALLGAVMRSGLRLTGMGRIMAAGA